MGLILPAFFLYVYVPSDSRELPRISMDPSRVNSVLEEVVEPSASPDAILRAQVLLARAHFSCGEIDARYGRHTRKAIWAFQSARGIAPTGVVGPETWKVLNADPGPALTPYPISEQDVAGPFLKLPMEMMEKAKFPAMNYESPLEALAEKFHSSPKLLQTLNAGVTFDQAGAQILVPNVLTAPPAAMAAMVVVDGSDFSVTALDAEGKTIAYYPATVGSERDPLPVGKWKIQGKRFNPPFHYNPQLFWDAEATDQKTTIAPGPNNPVGVVWIDLSKEHYGIHGTSEPSSIGRTQSHGCIRLTNWDAWELANMVKPGTPAILKK